VDFPNIDPYVLGLEWNSFGVRWYALAYVAGILLGWWYGIRTARNEAIWGPRAPVMSREQIDDLVLWVTVGVIVGGRLGSMLFYNTAALWERPLEVFKIWQGGMSFHGGLIGVMIAMLVFAKFNKIHVFRISDLVAPAVPIGLFFGRIANFINGELWGSYTRLPWGFNVPPELLPAHDQFKEFPHHPSQLYEAALEGLVLFIILRIATHHLGQLKKPGFVTGLFLAGYGFFRFMVEFVRLPDDGMEWVPLGLHMGQLLSLPMIIAGVWLMVVAKPQAQAVPATAKKAAKPKTAKAK
jgi:phosphatidylglycerol:prolipoprotein diacylglycerol transferase